MDELRSEALRRTSWPLWMNLPPPDTPILVSGALGRYRIPLGNFAGRDEFRQPPDTPLGDWRAAADGSHAWDSVTLAFWMPDGAAVQSDAAALLLSARLDPDTLTWRNHPFRPLEEDRPDPSADRYVAVVGALCPLDVSDPRSGQGGTIFMGGYAAGIGLDICHAGDPGAQTDPVAWGWTLVRSDPSVRAYCDDPMGYCFAYVRLQQPPAKALLYVPSDRISEIGSVAARIQALLQGWKVAPGAG